MRSVAEMAKILVVVALVFGVAACSRTQTTQMDPSSTQSPSDTGTRTTDTTLAPRVLKDSPRVPGPLLPGIQPVYFDFDRSLVRPDQVSRVEAVRDYMKANADDYVLIEGHCDERGTRQYNMALGQRRADAVHHELVRMGISPERLETVSYGEEQPVSTEKNEAGWALDRRAEFRELLIAEN